MRFSVQVVSLHKQNMATILGHSYMNDNPIYYILRLYENLFDIRCRVQGGLAVSKLINER